MVLWAIPLFFWAGDKNDRRPATNNNGNLVRDVFSHMCIAMCRRCWNGRSYWGPGRRRTRGRSSFWSTGFVYLFYWLLYKRLLLPLSPFIRPSLSFPHPRALGQPYQLQVSHLLFFSFILLFGKICLWISVFPQWPQLHFLLKRSSAFGTSSGFGSTSSSSSFGGGGFTRPSSSSLGGGGFVKPSASGFNNPGVPTYSGGGFSKPSTSSFGSAGGFTKPGS